MTQILGKTFEEFAPFAAKPNRIRIDAAGIERPKKTPRSKPERFSGEGFVPSIKQEKPR